MPWIGSVTTVRVKFWRRIRSVAVASRDRDRVVAGRSAAGVPDSVPSAASVTPVGRAPVSVNVEAGKPEAVTLNVLALPCVNVVELALVMVGGEGCGMVRLTQASPTSPPGLFWSPS